MRLKKILFVFLGTISLALACIGIIIPILPTTPFLLLTLYFYANGSERFHKWFINTSLYRKHLESFVINRSMTLKTKLSILLTASAMLMFPLIIIDNIIVRCIIIFLYIFKYYYFFTKIKTIEELPND